MILLESKPLTLELLTPTERKLLDAGFRTVVLSADIAIARPNPISSSDVLVSTTSDDGYKDIKAIAVPTTPRIQFVRTVGRDVQRAPIPLVPRAALTAVRKCREIAGSDAKPYIVFEPEWEPNPRADPVILFEIPDRDGNPNFWEVYRWGGIEELRRLEGLVRPID